MINFIWLAFIAIGIIVAGINGQINVITDAALTSAQNAVKVSLQLIGIMAFWLGIMKIAENGGLVQGFANLLKPVTGFLFPSVPKDHPAMGAIILNISANILGLGNAATPMGLVAMKELQTLNKDKEVATDAMCTFLALNTSCITLIPATVIGIRMQAGSFNPTEIVGPTIFATCCGMFVAVFADRLLRKWYGARGRA